MISAYFVIKVFLLPRSAPNYSGEFGKGLVREFSARHRGRNEKNERDSGFIDDKDDELLRAKFNRSGVLDDHSMCHKLSMDLLDCADWPTVYFCSISSL